MRYVVYLRVSTRTQVEGTSLEEQEAEARAWLRRGRHRLVEVCVDAGRSGALDVGDRPGLARALALAGGDKADGILVYRLHRLARDMILQEQILAELHRLGKELHSCSPSEDESLVDAPEDPTRALVRRILGSVHQYNRETIRLRLRAGHMRKKLAGGYAAGAPPYGWAAVRGELVKIPGEQSGIRLMRRLRAEGASYRQIAAELERRGIPSRASHEKWRPNTIRAILLRAELTRPPAEPSPALAERSA